MSSGDDLVVDYHLDPLISHLDTVLAVGTTPERTGQGKHFPEFYCTFLDIPLQRMLPLRIPSSTSSIDTSFCFSNPPVTQPTLQWAQPPSFNMSRSVRNYSYGPVTMPHTDHRWFEYILPHRLRYFNNPRKSATTALDLRNFSKLD